MRGRRVILGLLLVVAAGAGAWVLHRSGVLSGPGEASRTKVDPREGADATAQPTLEGVGAGRTRQAPDAEGAPKAAELASGTSATGTLRVRVSHEDTPIEGAQVALRLEGTPEHLAPARRTDQAGQVSLARVPAPKGSGAGDLRVEVRAEGFQPTLEQVPQDDEVLDVRLEPGVAFDGHVVDARTGAAVAGARVVLDHWLETYDLGATDVSGRFHVAGARAEDSNALVVSAPGFARAVHDFTIQDGKPSAEVVVRLEAGGTLRGVVRSAEGAPVAYAHVLVALARLLPKPPLPEDAAEDDLERGYDDDTLDWREGWEVRKGGRRARTDAEGRFQLDGLPLDEALAVVVEAAGHADALPLTDVLLTPAARERDVVLTMRRPTFVVVRVRMPDGRTLPADARVRFLQENVPRAPEPRATDGTFRISAVPGWGYAFVHAEGFRTASRRIDVREGETLTTDLVLDAGATVEGVVVDAEGRPFQGAHVQVAPRKDNLRSRGDWLSNARSAPSGDDGRFVVEGLPHEDLLLVARTYEDRIRGTQEPIPLKLPARDVQVVLRPLCLARMRLVLPSGEPFRGDLHTMLTVDGSGSGGQRHVGPDGVLTEQGLRNAVYRWEVRPAGHAWFERRFTVRDWKDVDVGDVVVDPGVTLRGRVVDVAGRPVPGVEVHSERGTVTDGEGAFVLEHCPREPIGLYTSKPGYAEAWHRVDPSHLTVVEVRLHRAVTVRGVLRRPGGAVSEDDTIHLRRPGAVARAETYTDEEGQERTYDNYDEEEWLSPEPDGTFEHDAIPSGRWVGWWHDEARGEDVRVGEWDFTEGRAHVIEITLPK